MGRRGCRVHPLNEWPGAHSTGSFDTRRKRNKCGSCRRTPTPRQDPQESDRARAANQDLNQQGRDTKNSDSITEIEDEEAEDDEDDEDEAAGLGARP